jgi:two-component system cell cycle sensor histidine kinase/response regulator CckA
VQSTPGRGTRFTVELPRHQDDGREEVLVPEPTPLPRGAGTILLVEDEPAIRTLAARVLRSQGYTVLEVPDAEEALGLCPPGAAIDLLLTDIVLPGMRGPALADELRQRVPALRVLLMSGYPDYAALDEQGRETILLKPFTATRLAKAVRVALEE